MPIQYYRVADGGTQSPWLPAHLFRKMKATVQFELDCYLSLLSVIVTECYGCYNF